MKSPEKTLSGNEKYQIGSITFGQRTKSMLSVDFRRMFTTPLYYIMTGICLVMPILILVMTTMMDGSVSVDPNTGTETAIQGFTSVWQVIASVSGESAGMDMSMTGMCNINLIYFMAAVFVAIDVLLGIIGKQKLWLSMVGSLCVGMLLFTMVPMMTPLDSGFMNVILCLAGGVLFSLGIGAGSNVVLQKTSLV